MFSKMDVSFILCKREIKKNQNKENKQPLDLFERGSVRTLEKNGLNERLVVETGL